MRRLIVFLGPSLPRREARRIVKADYRPPARQGDVFRALVDRPTALALIDGVFEAQPSVWHQELRAALASGVAVFGASSMGALRAAELASEGMVGVGEIVRRYQRGEWRDDADVALLHADGAHAFRPLTVPLVNVRATATAAAKARVLGARDARRLVAEASARHYQDRRWPALLATLPAAARARLKAWLPTGQVDLKAQDARECLRVAAGFVRSGAPAPAPRPFDASSFVRRRRLMDTAAATVRELQRRPDRLELEELGTLRLLLASFARAAGLEVDQADLARALRRVPAAGLAPDERASLAQVLALGELVLAAPERFVADGPTRLEGLVLEARRRGLWKRGT